jgi:hypothetical protein
MCVRYSSLFELLPRKCLIPNRMNDSEADTARVILLPSFQMSPRQGVKTPHRLLLGAPKQAAEKGVAAAEPVPI